MRIVYACRYATGAMMLRCYFAAFFFSAAPARQKRAMRCAIDAAAAADFFHAIALSLSYAAGDARFRCQLIMMPCCRYDADVRRSSD